MNNIFNKPITQERINELFNERLKQQQALKTLRKKNRLLYLMIINSSYGIGVFDNTKPITIEVQ